MLDVQIGRRHRRMAQPWNELTSEQLLQVSRIHGAAYATEAQRDRALLLEVLLLVPALVLRKVNTMQVVNLKAYLYFLKDPHQHRFDVVLFWGLDRFSREGALATLQYLNQLDSWKVGYKSFTE